mgnify:FL=1|jgi:hypothetical protein
MIKYKSYIYSGIGIPFVALLVSILFYFIAIAFFVDWVSWIVISFGIALFVYSFKWINNEMFDIYFKENEIEIKYVYGKKIQIINYQDLIKYTFIETSKSSNNSFKTKDFHFVFNRVVGNNHFIEFYKFLKSKNENLEIEIFPLSSNLEYLRQQEFGLSYRKILKETL